MFQDKNHRPAEIENLVNEIKIPLEIRRIDDAQDAIRLRGCRCGARATHRA